MPLPSSVKQVIRDTAQQAHAKGFAAGYQAMKDALALFAQLNGSAHKVAKAFEPPTVDAEPDPPDAMPPDAVRLLVAAMVEVAAHHAENDTDPTAELEQLADLANDPGQLQDLIDPESEGIHKAFRWGVVLKAWDNSLHPRDDGGRFISKDKLNAAKTDPKKAKELLARTTRPEEREKLEKVLAGHTDPGQTKRGQQRLDAHGRRTAREQAHSQAHRIAYAAMHGEATPEKLTELATHLPNLTVAQLRDVRAMLGVDRSDRTKSAIVAKLVAHAVERAKPVEASPETPGPAPATEPPAPPPMPKTKSGRMAVAKDIDKQIKAARDDVAKALGTRDINDRLTPRMNEIELNLLKINRTLASGHEYDGTTDHGEVTPERYAGYQRGAAKLLAEYKAEAAGLKAEPTPPVPTPASAEGAKEPEPTVPKETPDQVRDRLFAFYNGAAVHKDTTPEQVQDQLKALDGMKKKDLLNVASAFGKSLIGIDRMPEAEVRKQIRRAVEGMWGSSRRAKHDTESEPLNAPLPPLAKKTKPSPARAAYDQSSPLVKEHLDSAAENLGTAPHEIGTHADKDAAKRQLVIMHDLLHDSGKASPKDMADFQTAMKHHAPDLEQIGTPGETVKGDGNIHKGHAFTGDEATVTKPGWKVKNENGNDVVYSKADVTPAGKPAPPAVPAPEPKAAKPEAKPTAPATPGELHPVAADIKTLLAGFRNVRKTNERHETHGGMGRPAWDIAGETPVETVNAELSKLDKLPAPELLQIAKQLNAAATLTDRTPAPKIRKQIKEMVIRVWKTASNVLH